MIEFIVGVILAAVAVTFVLYPVLRSTMGPATVDMRRSDEDEDPEDDMSRRAVAVRALREIEFDRATGKLSDADYDALRTKYTAEALAASRTEERVAAEGVARPTSPVTRPSAPSTRPVCPTHGARPEPDAAFCSDCGRRLGTAPGYCARCGTALVEREARFCHSCGARIAA